MRIVSTRVHGILDYAMGVALAVSPWLLGYSVDGAETWVPVGIGFAVIGYSLLTDYELGVARVISTSTHLRLDALAGLFLLISPVVFGFSGLVWVPHALLGAAGITVALVTRKRPVRRYWPAR